MKEPRKKLLSLPKEKEEKFKKMYEEDCKKLESQKAVREFMSYPLKLQLFTIIEELSSLQKDVARLMEKNGLEPTSVNIKELLIARSLRRSFINDGNKSDLSK